MLKFTRLRVLICVFSVISILIVGCFNSYTPVPREKAYFRVDLPEHDYVGYDSDCPFTFEYPKYAMLNRDSIYFNQAQTNPCWFNLEIESFKATIHITYNSINQPEDIDRYLNDSHDLSWKHTVKASFIKEEMLEDVSKSLYGRIYHIGGNAASPYQFYLTDSAKHFLRASLYFASKPNIDSMGLVVEHVVKDTEHLINTFSWK